MYYVIHSKDPYLLARFCTELQMEGLMRLSNDHPFGEYDLLAIYNGQIYNLYEHVFGNPTRFTLTSRNYTEVLEAVLTNKTK